MTDDQNNIEDEEIDWNTTTDWTSRPGFVNRGYINDPEIEELLFDGTYLRDGMRVLNGRTSSFQELSWIGNDLCEERAMENNRWCTISHVREERTRDYRFISFFATYDDGIKIKRQVSIHDCWIVKKDSIPQTHEHNEECFEYFPGFPADLVCEEVRETNAVSPHPTLSPTDSPWGVGEEFKKSIPSLESLLDKAEMDIFLRNPEIPERIKFEKVIQKIQLAVRDFNIALLDLKKITLYVNTKYGKMKSPRAPGEEDPV